MATYWAQLDTENIVTQVTTGVDDPTIEGIPACDWYSNAAGVPCVQTFMDDPNKTYAGIGDTYSYDTEDFTAPYQPPAPPLPEPVEP